LNYGRGPEIDFFESTTPSVIEEPTPSVTEEDEADDLEDYMEKWRERREAQGGTDRAGVTNPVTGRRPEIEADSWGEALRTMGRGALSVASPMGIMSTMASMPWASGDVAPFGLRHAIGEHLGQVREQPDAPTGLAALHPGARRHATNGRSGVASLTGHGVGSMPDATQLGGPGITDARSGGGVTSLTGHGVGTMSDATQLGGPGIDTSDRQSARQRQAREQRRSTPATGSTAASMTRSSGPRRGMTGR
jgi:hypothetical protein